MIVAEVDAGSALIASTLVTALGSVVVATIALRANRNARSAKENTQENGGSSSHDKLIGRIDGWGMTLERQIIDAAKAASDADRHALLSIAAVKQNDMVQAGIAEKLDSHLVSSAEFGGLLAEGATEVLERLDALDGKGKALPDASS